MDDHRVPPDRMRASDTDRDAVVDLLAEALREGRLDLGEYDERLAGAMRAKTMGELAALTADLPESSLPARPPTPVGGAARPGTRRSAPVEPWRRRIEPWRGPVGVSILLIGIWAVTSAATQSFVVFWPLIPIGIMFVFTLAGVITGDGPDRDGPKNGSR